MTNTLHQIRGNHIELCPASSGYSKCYLKKEIIKVKTPSIKSSSRVPEKRRGLNILNFLLEGPPICPGVPSGNRTNKLILQPESCDVTLWVPRHSNPSSDLKQKKVHGSCFGKRSAKENLRYNK